MRYKSNILLLAVLLAVCCGLSSFAQEAASTNYALHQHGFVAGSKDYGSPPASGGYVLKACAADGISGESAISSSYTHHPGFLHPGGGGSTIPGGSVSGTWTAASSPYIINGEIDILEDSTLVIGPGVQVVFSGHHKFRIYGRLLAQGSAADSIFFTASDTTTGWHGLRFYNTDSTGQDSSLVEHCHIEYGRASGGVYPDFDGFGGAICVVNSSRLRVSDCLVTDCTAQYSGGGVFGTMESPPSQDGSSAYFEGVTIRNCQAENAGAMSVAENTYLKDLLIDSNTAAQASGGIYCVQNVTLDGVTISNNSAGTNGGGMRIHQLATAHLIDVALIGNFAGEAGGGIHDEQSDSVYDGVLLQENEAQYWGGGIYLSMTRSILSDLRLIGNTAQTAGGIYFWFSDVSLTDATFIDNYANNGGGAYLDRSHPTLDGGAFLDNTVHFDGGALQCDISTMTFNNVTFSGNSATNPQVDAGGMYLRNGCHMTLHNCIMWDNTPDEIVFQSYNDPDTVTVSYTDFRGGQSGIVTNGNGTVYWLDGNLDADPLFADTTSGDYSLSFGSPCIDAGDPASPLDPDGTVTEMGYYYFPQVSGSISGSIDGDINIDGAAYVPQDSTLDIGPGVQVNFCGNNTLSIYGQMQALGTPEDSITFTVCDTTGYESMARTFTGWGGLRFIDLDTTEQDSSYLAYCKLEYGWATGAAPDNYGGAVYCLNSSRLAIEHTLIARSRAQRGGGVYCENSSPRLYDVLIEDNVLDYGITSYGGGIYMLNSHPLLQAVTIRGQTRQSGMGSFYGGGIYCSASNPVLEDVVISDNSEEPSYTRGGGLFCQDSAPQLTRTLIADNLAYQGGGIYVDGAPGPVLNKVTVAGNTAGDGADAGGMTSTGSTPNVNNTIFWGNSNLQIIADSAAVTYSDVEGGWSGTGNIDADPLFVDAGGGDYSLQEVSPCIDTGDPDPGWNDPDGTRADMGAYYYYHVIPGVPQNLVIQVSGDEIQLSWDAVENADGYLVYSSSDAYTGYAVDESGNLAGTTWTAPLPAGPKFYLVRSVIEE